LERAEGTTNSRERNGGAKLVRLVIRFSNSDRIKKGGDASNALRSSGRAMMGGGKNKTDEEFPQMVLGGGRGYLAGGRRRSPKKDLGKRTGRRGKHEHGGDQTRSITVNNVRQIDTTERGYFGRGLSATRGRGLIEVKSATGGPNDIIEKE